MQPPRSLWCVFCVLAVVCDATIISPKFLGGERKLCIAGFYLEGERCVMRSSVKPKVVCRNGKVINGKCVRYFMGRATCPQDYKLVGNMCVLHKESPSTVTCTPPLEMVNGICQTELKIDPQCPLGSFSEGDRCVWQTATHKVCKPGYSLMMNTGAPLETLASHKVLDLPKVSLKARRNNSECVQESAVEPLIICRPGEKLVKGTPEVNSVFCETTIRSPILCDLGSVDIGDGQCTRYSPPEQRCTEGFKLSPQGLEMRCKREIVQEPNVSCTSGTYDAASGFCVSQNVGDGCASNSRDVCREVNAACPIGFRKQGRSCVMHTRDPLKCPEGARWHEGMCIDTEGPLVQQPTCPNGFENVICNDMAMCAADTPRECEKKVTVELLCKEGRMLENGRCIVCSKEESCEDKSPPSLSCDTNFVLSTAFHSDVTLMRPLEAPQCVSTIWEDAIKYCPSKGSVWTDGRCVSVREKKCLGKTCRRLRTPASFICPRYYKLIEQGQGAEGLLPKCVATTRLPADEFCAEGSEAIDGQCVTFLERICPYGSIIESGENCINCTVLFRQEPSSQCPQGFTMQKAHAPLLLNATEEKDICIARSVLPSSLKCPNGQTVGAGKLCRKEMPMSYVCPSGSAKEGKLCIVKHYMEPVV